MHKIKSIIQFLFILFVAIFTPISLFASDIILNDTVSVSATVIRAPSATGSYLTSVTFSGFAYPEAIVHLWKNGVPQTTAYTFSDGSFNIRLDEVYSPNALYSLYAIDKMHRRSLILNYPIVVKSGYLTQISGILFAPTISLDKTEVKNGDYITVSGYALPTTSLSVVIKGIQDKTFYMNSNSDGTYQLTIPLLDFKKGDYNIYVNYKNSNKISKVILFTIGEVNILSTELVENIPGDCNADSIINIIDFSVTAFWYDRPNPPVCVDTNDDNIINLTDFSILAFYWTG